MNKIHNNLNIDNLMRTDWINQFKPYQQKEIRFRTKIRCLCLFE